MLSAQKKEGRKREREERDGERETRERERDQGEDELFEAERVVKLRLVQAETGEARQLWKCVWGTLQVSPPQLEQTLTACPSSGC